MSKMKIYLIERCDDICFDENVSHVIIAKSEKSARKLARKKDKYGSYSSWKSAVIRCIGKAYSDKKEIVLTQTLSS